MITLGVSGSLQGKAGTASAITYTVSGDTISSGSDTFSILAQGQLGTSVAALTGLSSVTGPTLIKDIHLSNSSGSLVSGVVLYVNGSSASNQLVTVSIPANGQAVYSDGGWSVTDGSGNLQQSLSTSLSGDVTGTTASNTVVKIQGVAQTTGTATILSQMTNGQTRNATATLNAGEQTIFTGSTGSQTLTLPTTPQVSTTNTILNSSSVTFTLAAGAGNTINNFGIIGSVTMAVNQLIQLVFIGTTWYAVDTNAIASSVGSIGVGQLPAITGDVSIPAGSGVSTLATVNSNTGSFGNTNTIPVPTVNAKGLITAVSTATITPAAIGAQATGNYVTGLTGDITASGPGSVAATLATVNSNTGSFGTATQSPTITVNGKGLITAASNTSIQSASATQAGFLAAADYSHIASGWYDVTRQGTNSVLTSNTGSVNNTAISNLMTAVPSGSVLYFPPGWYTFASTITIPAKVFIFQGSGAGLNGALSAFTWTTNNAGDWITQTASDYYMQFRDIGFIAQAAQTAGSCINVNGNANNIIKNCAFTGLSSSLTIFNGINFTGTNGGEESIVEQCVFTNFTGTAIICNSSLETVVIDGITINGGAIGAAGVSVLAGGAVQITSCDIIGCTNNLLINPTSTVASVWCVNSYFDSSAGSCIKISGSSAVVRTKFEQCSFTVSATASPANAVEISSTYAYGAVGQGTDFINCNVLNTFGTLGVGTGFNITGAADFRIMGCNIAAWATGIAITPANSAGMTRPQIIGNTIGNAGGYGINTTGINLNAGSFTYGSILLTDNEMDGNTIPISDSSSVAVTASKFIGNNTGLVARTTLAPLASGGASYLATAGRGAVTSGTTETFLATYRIPPSSVTVGQTFRLTAVLQSSSTGTWIPTIRSGATGTIASDTSIATHGATAAQVANGYTRVTAIVEVVALGSTSTVTGYVESQAGQAVPGTVYNKTAAAEVLASTPTTAAWFITFSGTASTGTYTVKTLSMEAV
ncbi:MAG TPA: hypothetical protein VMQ58_01375 [Candidatus Saccharimonadales bacterium]|nr:hypothetical protein [Candidatus Saccharimonadales bacterium]